MNTSDVKVETIIEASTTEVWSIIANFSDWSRWHKSQVKVITRKGIPTTLKTTFSGVPVKINLINVKMEEGKYLEWTGALPLSRNLLSGTRKFSLKQISDSRCILLQEEMFSGLVSKIFKKRLVSSYQTRYAAHNQKIKQIAETKP